MIETIKDLEKLLKLIRKQGVMSFEHHGTKITLGDLPVELTADASDDPYANFPDGELTPEQLMEWSLGKRPGSDQ
jgi:hypothetical protein